MSLDLYIKSRTPIKHRGTGVHIRENGQTRELKTIEEVKAHFPNADLSDIHIYEYEDNELFHFNMTHNLVEMAQHVPIAGTDINGWQLLWHSDECECFEKSTWSLKDSDGDDYSVEGVKLTSQYVDMVIKCLGYIANHRNELEVFNPDNGWGSYDGLLKNTRELVHCLINIPVEEYDNYIVYTWT
jgi:hypothetical protein